MTIKMLGLSIAIVFVALAFVCVVRTAQLREARLSRPVRPMPAKRLFGVSRPRPAFGRATVERRGV